MSKIRTNENIFGAAKKFTDAFFDALKTNTAHHILKKAEKSKKMPSPIIQKLKEMDRLAKELENDIKKYS